MHVAAAYKWNTVVLFSLTAGTSSASVWRHSRAAMCKSSKKQNWRKNKKKKNNVQLNARACAKITLIIMKNNNNVIICARSRFFGPAIRHRHATHIIYLYINNTDIECCIVLIICVSFHYWQLCFAREKKT